MVKNVAIGCFALFIVTLVAEVASAQLFFRRRQQCSTGQCNVLAYQAPVVTEEKIVRADDGGFAVFTQWHGPEFGHLATEKWSRDMKVTAREVSSRKRRFVSFRVFPTHPSYKPSAPQSS